MSAPRSQAHPGPPAPRRVVVVGPGRLGRALACALRAAGRDVVGPLGRGERAEGDGVLLCVPDGEIPAAAAAVAGCAPLVGHTSGATPLAALEPALAAGADGLGLHPLQTFSGAEGERSPARFSGAGCAVAGTTPAALEAARGLALSLGMRPFELEEERRAAYHAAASIASNFLVALEATAERVAGGAGLSPAEARALLAPLVRATVENWVELGPERALTGPVARGDELTVAKQRAAVRAQAPELLPLFDALAESARSLAAPRAPHAAEGAR